MLGTLKKIFAFAGNRKGLLKNSLFSFPFLTVIFASFQFGAPYFIVDALASDNHSLYFCMAGAGYDDAFHRRTDFLILLFHE